MAGPVMIVLRMIMHRHIANKRSENNNNGVVCFRKVQRQQKQRTGNDAAVERIVDQHERNEAFGVHHHRKHARLEPTSVSGARERDESVSESKQRRRRRRCCRHLPRQFGDVARRQDAAEQLAHRRQHDQK